MKGVLGCIRSVVAKMNQSSSHNWRATFKKAEGYNVLHDFVLLTNDIPPATWCSEVYLFTIINMGQTIGP